MICATAFGVCVSLGGPDASHVKIEPVEDAAAVVKLWNGEGPVDGSNPSTVTITLDGIEVTLVIAHTFNSACRPVLCPDTMEVVDITPGYIAVPSAITVDEYRTGEIFIHEYFGG